MWIETGLGSKFFDFSSCSEECEGVETSRETAGSEQATTFS